MNKSHSLRTSKSFNKEPKDAISLNDFAKTFGVENIASENEVIIKIKNEEFLVSKELNEALSKIPEKPYCAGIPLGTTGKIFTPSVFLLELLSEHSKNKIVINDKAEWLFLCGRDVFDESIVKNKATSDTFLVQNSKDENLGFSKRIRTGGTFLIKNMLDRGDFLRRERK